MVLASTRLLTTSLAGGQQTAQRQRIEAEIASDLDLISQQDESQLSSVTAALTANSGLPSACVNPASSLKQQIDTNLSSYTGPLWSRQTSTTSLGLLKVAYVMTMPGGQDIRVMEIVPAIQNICLQRSLFLN